MTSTGGKPFEEMDGGTRSVRVNLRQFQMAVYETEGIVSSVWYNDPAGRLTSFGRRKKIDLYLQRFTVNGEWEPRLSSGGIVHFFNDIDGFHMAYGVHMDVIRFNARGGADAA